MRGKVWRAAYLWGVSLIMLSCSASEAPIEEQKIIEGISGVNLGTNFEELIGTVDFSEFNPVAVTECLRDIATEGCYLSPVDDDTIFMLKNNIPYNVSLSINKLGKVTDINIGYNREGSITRADCISVFERTLDWATQEYGQFAPAKFEEPPTEKATFLSPTKQKYYIENGDAETAISLPMSTRLPAQQKAITDYTKQYSWTLLTFITVAEKPICRITLALAEPDDVERPSSMES